ncbi:aminopeptidase N-like [Bombyx mandarina]|uniref:Aminopeptidase n=1 Tax=Bombyx mandarina TaxID=7092 RepID=A0A6J2K795_BOMMA|nr:aminopeptidase N-like [Bombyx mandarina]
MYLLLITALLGSAYSFPTSTLNNVTRNTDLASQYVLPGESFPTFYDVSLFIDPANTVSFNGKVSIRIIPRIATNVIVVQAMEMTIRSISVFTDRNSNENLFASFTLATDDTHFLRISTRTQLLPDQPYIVNIDYESKYAPNMFGVYVSTYQQNGRTVNLVTSQLQPTFARRAFPCYDEPAIKAIFRTTIYAPAAYTVVRHNTPERTVPLKEDVAGYVKHEFEDTLVMSTYLLAYLVSNFEHVSNEQNPIYRVPFRVYSRPGTQTNAAFAMDFGQKNMVALEAYNEFPYAFPKLDKAAVPDFAAGAMENWGLVIYREVALLVTEGVTTTATRQNIARIICHENVHMWYGNEVGPLSWTYTWLNEGFATFFESFATDLVLPEWRMMEQFVVTMQNVFQSDAVLTINPMTHAVYTPSQIMGQFNAIAYQKSGSVIRMLHHFLTPEIFRRGLVIYIINNSRRAAGPSDLYAALQQALDASDHSIPYSISNVMSRWVNQGGFPVLNVRKSAPNANSVFISQERYLTDRSLTSTDRWHVPVNWVLSSNIDFSDTKPQGWIPPSFPATSIDIPGLANAEWFIFNKQQTGYYRVNYDPENWAALARVLQTNHAVIHLLNRAQILDDSFNMARNGRLNYNLPFEISRYLINEKDYIPWAAINPAFNYLDIVLTGSSVYNLFREYLLTLTAPLYDEIGWEATANEEHVMAYHRNIILDINCRLGNQRCITRAQELLEQFRNNPTQRLNPDLQNTVYCSGLRGGDRDNFNFLWEQYLATSDSSEQNILLNALGCTSNPELRTFYMNQVIDANSPVREQDRHTILVSVINSSPENMDAALEFVIENFHRIQPRVQGLTGTTNILNAFARRLTTETHAERINQLVSRHQAIFSAGEQASISAIREHIAASIAWGKDNAAVVEDWLEDNYGEPKPEEPSAAHSTTAGFIVLLSAVVAFFNIH